MQRPLDSQTSLIEQPEPLWSRADAELRLHGDPLSALDWIDPSFAPDPLFDAPDELTASMWRPRRRTGVAIAVALAAGSLSACGEEPTPLHTGDAILVKLKDATALPSQLQTDDSSPPVIPIANLAADDEPPLLRLPLPGSRGAEAFARDLAMDEAVAFAEPIFLYSTSRVPDDPRFRDLWGLSRIEAPAAWERTIGSRRVTVAVIDDGVAVEHPDLAPNIAQDGYDFVEERPDPRPQEGTRWHGTHVAGIIGAAGNNGAGVSGVSWNVSLLPLRAISRNEGRSDVLARAIDFATDHGARIINASWGGGGASRAIARAIDRAGEHGVLFVAAAGNLGAERPSFPASLNLPNVVSVGATTPGGALAGFSNRRALILAPGVGILSTTAPGNYERYDGTSMAAAHVSGVAALLWSARPDASVRDVRSSLLDSASEHGEVNAARALQAIVAAGDARGDLVASPPALSASVAPSNGLPVHVLSIRRAGGGQARFSAIATAPWIHLSAREAETPSSLEIRFDPTALSPGTHQAAIRISDQSASDGALTIPVALHVVDQPKVVADGPGCTTREDRIHVRAGSLCALTSPGVQPTAIVRGVTWVMPGGARSETGRLFARFVRKGVWPLRVLSTEGEDQEVTIMVE